MKQIPYVIRPTFNGGLNSTVRLGAYWSCLNVGEEVELVMDGTRESIGTATVEAVERTTFDRARTFQDHYLLNGPAGFRDPINFSDNFRECYPRTAIYGDSIVTVIHFGRVGRPKPKFKFETGQVYAADDGNRWVVYGFFLDQPDLVNIYTGEKRRFTPDGVSAEIKLVSLLNGDK